MKVLGNARDTISNHSYPTTTEELIEDHGEIELTLPDGTETLGEALSRLESETLETPEDAHYAAYSALSSKAIGRKGYSDRDPVSPGEDGPDPLSF